MNGTGTLRMGELHLQQQKQAKHHKAKSKGHHSHSRHRSEGTHSGFGMYSPCTGATPTSANSKHFPLHEQPTPISTVRKQFSISPLHSFAPGQNSGSSNSNSMYDGGGGSSKGSTPTSLGTLPQLNSTKSMLSKQHSHKSSFGGGRSFEDELSPFSSNPNSPNASIRTNHHPNHQHHKRPTGPLSGEFLDPRSTTIKDAYNKDPLFNCRSTVRQQALMDLAQNQVAQAKAAHSTRRLPSRAQSAEVASSGLTPLDGGYNAAQMKLAPMENGERRLPHRHTTSAPAKAEDYLQKFPAVPNKPFLPASPIKSGSTRHLGEVMKPILEDTSSPSHPGGS